MAESVTSGAYWYTFTESVATVQSWLAPTRVGDLLRATSVMAHRGDLYGTATMTMTNGSYDVVCSGVARAVRVGRTSDALQGPGPRRDRVVNRPPGGPARRRHHGLGPRSGVGRAAYSHRDQPR